MSDHPDPAARFGFTWLRGLLFGCLLAAGLAAGAAVSHAAPLHDAPLPEATLVAPDMTPAAADATPAALEATFAAADATPAAPDGAFPAPDAARRRVFLPMVGDPFAPGGTPPPTYTPTRTVTPTRTRTATPQTVKPQDGHWTGTTAANYPVSFDVSQGGTRWTNFYLKARLQNAYCTMEIQIGLTSPGGAITNGKFSGSSGNGYSFTGQFTSPTAARGTYTFANYYDSYCGYFNQTGTWTAHK